MKLFPNSTISADALKGAIVTNEHDGEGELMEGTVGVPFTSLKKWSIQLQPTI